MQDMSGRAPYTPGNPLSSQQRADAQISNPAAPITATAWLEPTQPTDNLRSSDPSNGGVVPVDAAKLWSGLKNFSINDINFQLWATTAWESSIYSKSFGIDTWWFSKDEVDKMNATIIDPNNSNIVYWKEITKRQGNYGDQSLQAKFLDAVNTIDLDKKTASSWVGVNPNIGIDIDTVVQLTEELLKTSSTAKNDPNLWQAYNAYIGALNEALKTGNPDAIRSAVEWPAGALKVALAPIVDKAMRKEWFDNNKVETQQYYWMKKILDGLLEYKKYFDASSDELRSAIQKYKEQTGKYKVEYKQIIGPNAYQTKSQNAASKMKSSPLYQNFIWIMKEIDPDMKDILSVWSKDTVISEKEEAYLKKNLFGHESIKQMLDLRSRMIAEQWPAAAAYFKEYQEIIDLYKTFNASAIDDYIDRSKSIPSNYDLKNLRFQVKSWY